MDKIEAGRQSGSLIVHQRVDAPRRYCSRRVDAETRSTKRWKWLKPSSGCAKMTRNTHGCRTSVALESVGGLGKHNKSASRLMLFLCRGDAWAWVA